MDTKNIPSPPHRKVRINRDNPRTPFLSNIVGGEIEQTQPNGTTYCTVQPLATDGVRGFGNHEQFTETVGPQAPTGWPSGNRSGE